jgi:tetratricopeptide (TPR) repeat protein
MSTSMYAMTIIADLTMKSHLFENANALMVAKPVALLTTMPLKTFDGTDNVITKVSGSSRGNFFCNAVARICTLSGISGLEMFAGKLSPTCHWKLPLFEDSTSEFACGYWLEAATLSTTLDALIKLLDWSKKNIHQLQREQILNYYDGVDTKSLLHAIANGSRMNSGRMQNADPDGEGVGVAYLFAYLGTVRQLLANAMAAAHPVIHVAEVYGSEPSPTAVVSTSEDDHDAQFWLDEGEEKLEEVEILDGSEATRALKEAIKCFSTALSMNSKLADAHYGWGCALSQLAQNSKEKKAREFWSSANVQFDKALSLRSELSASMYDVLCKTGDALYQLAWLSPNGGATNLWKAAIVKFEEALTLPPSFFPAIDVCNLHIECGSAQFKLSWLSAEDEAVQLREAAKVNFQASLKLVSDEPDNWSCIGSVLFNLAKCSETSVRPRLWREAKVQLIKAEELMPGSEAYDLSCVEALSGNIASALSWLKVAALHGTLPSKSHILEDSDLQPIQSDPAVVAWLATL